MSGLIGLVVLVADIVAIVDCVKTKKETGQKILWIVLILVLPIIGMLAYFLIGRK